MIHCSRRQFMQAAAVAGLGALAPLAMAAPGETQAPDALIIDTHEHLWDLSRFHVAWLARASAVHRRSYLPSHYAQATQGLNVRSVYMEIDLDQAQRGAEAEYAIEQCRQKQGPMRAAVIGARPEAPGFAEFVAPFKDHPFVRGVRHILHGAAPRGHCLTPEFVKGTQRLGELGLSFDLCVRPTELDDGVKLTELAPATRFIVDHCGNGNPAAFHPFVHPTTRPVHDPEIWKRGMDNLAARPNVICKISGIIGAADKEQLWADTLAPIINHCLDAFGPDRVVFGGDWPVCLLGAPLKAWIATLKQIIASRPAEDQRKLWSGNAIKFYRLSI